MAANEIAYGFMGLEDIFDLRVLEATRGVEVVDTAITQSVEEYNRIVNGDVLPLFVRRTTAFQTAFRTIGSNRLQPLDEDGRALPVKGLGSYTTAWPLRRGGTAWGEGWEAGIKMTVSEANHQTNLMTVGDQKWLLDHVMSALFMDDSYVFADKAHGNLTVLPLANGDGQTYMRTGGSGVAATAQHHLFQAAGIADSSNPFKGIRDLLKGYPGNSGQVLALVASDLLADIQNLANFRMAPDPNVSAGALDSVLTGRLGVSLPSGREADGYVDGVWISEWDMIPSGFMISLVTGGERPVAMREDETPELRGFIQAGVRVDFPWTERQYRRLAGFGAWNRVGAAVTKIGAGSYAPPVTGEWDFNNPMP